MKSPYISIQSPHFAMKSPYISIKSTYFAMKSPYIWIQSPHFAMKSPYISIQSPHFAMKYLYILIQSPHFTHWTLKSYFIHYTKNVRIVTAKQIVTSKLSITFRQHSILDVAFFLLFFFKYILLYITEILLDGH